ncbi:MAG: hypothetical protein R3175_11105 [Marinobacter sp.]|uniref:hypothetical protein n=1 Tax=Marinobacter sp. TaxID=50741 RepID=UPI00299DA09B|nr:hypothetical protein [Marinobacter sp.]MDX1756598.1 hypothetical protein [Marinobacter sp.]
MITHYGMAIRFVIAWLAAGLIYACGLFVGDFVLGSKELLYQWEFGSRRELLAELIQNFSIVGITSLLGLLVTAWLYSLKPAIGRLGVIAAGLLFYIASGQALVLSLVWLLALIGALLLVRGARL